MPRTVSPYNPVLPTSEEMAAARAAIEQLAAKHRLGLVDKETGATADLPDAAIALIRRLLSDFAAGRAVMLIPLEAEVTTFQAADILNVSRPYVVKLLEQGEIPFRMVGTHRRIGLENLLAYKQRMHEASEAAMDELVRISQEMGLYDDPQPMPPKSVYRKPAK